MRISSELNDDYGLSSEKLAKQHSVLRIQLGRCGHLRERCFGDWPLPLGNGQTSFFETSRGVCLNSRPREGDGLDYVSQTMYADAVFCASTHAPQWGEHPEKILPIQSGGFNSRSSMERITSPISAVCTCAQPDTASTPAFSLPHGMS